MINDVFKSPLSDFQREVANAGLEHRVHYLSHGQEYTLSTLKLTDTPAKYRFHRSVP